MSPGGVKKMMSLNALSGELDADLDGGMDSEMPSAEAGGETVAPDTNGEVASALGVLTGAAKAVGDSAKSEVSPGLSLGIAGVCSVSLLSSARRDRPTASLYDRQLGSIQVFQSCGITAQKLTSKMCHWQVCVCLLSHKGARLQHFVLAGLVHDMIVHALSFM